MGFVYVLTNPAFPNLVKVGKTGLIVDDRAKKLFTTGVPAPFKVAFVAMTSHRKAVERKAHQHLASHRRNGNREFFSVSADVAIKAIRLAMIDVAGISSWQSTTYLQIKSGDRLAFTLEAGQIFALISFPVTNSLFAGQPEIVDLWQAHSDGDVLEVFGASSPGHVAGYATQDPGALSDRNCSPRGRVERFAG